MTNQPFGFGSADDNNGFDMSKLGEMLEQVGSMMRRAEAGGDVGPVSWSTIREVARTSISRAGERAVTDIERKSVMDAVELAQTWLNSSTAFAPSSATAHAWSSSEWLELTLPQWQPVIDPVAAGLSQTIATISSEAIPEDGQVPAEVAQMMGPMIEFAKRMSAVTTGMQMGNGFGALAQEVLAAGDTSMPLSADFTPALLPNHITTFATEHELSPAEFMVFVAIREAALQRLYAANPWLRSSVIDAVARFARGITVDTDRIRQAVSEIDPENPESMQQLAASGAFHPATTDEQKRTLAEIELMLATIEGWISAVTDSAVANRLPSINAMTETMNRRRAAGGPAEKTFANLVGLSLRPRLIRDAYAFWKTLTDEVGVDQRDGFWAHPDLLPSAGELTDVSSFISLRKSE